jgi:prepilin peptidase CpaA
MDFVPAYAAAIAASAGAALDLRFQRIPNWLTAGALVSGVLLNAWLGGLNGVLVALSGAALGVVLLLPFYALHAMGAGDVKLLAALGAFVGPQVLVSVAVYGGLVGGVLSVGVLIIRGRLLGALRDALLLRTLPSPSGLKAPYGVAIAAGMILTLLLPGILG